VHSTMVASSCISPPRPSVDSGQSSQAFFRSSQPTSVAPGGPVVAGGEDDPFQVRAADPDDLSKLETYRAHSNGIILCKNRVNSDARNP
jgi:hypothetical protein